MQYKIWGVNLILVLASIFALTEAIAVWGDSRNSESDSVSILSDKPSVDDYASIAQRNTIPKAYYNDIVDDNLFSPQRMEYVPVKIKDVTEPEKEIEKEALPVTRKDIGIVLFGTIFLDDYKAAIISNPKNRNEQMTLHEGAEVDGMVLYEVKKDRVLIASDGEITEVLMFDSEKPKQRVAVARQASPNVVTPPAIVKSVPPATHTERPAIKTGSDNDEYEFVDTPFGKVRRKKK